MRVFDEVLRATTYEVPTGAAGQVPGQAASERIDDVEITRTGDGDPDRAATPRREGVGTRR